MKKTLTFLLFTISFTLINAQYDLTSFATNNSSGTAVENDSKKIFYSSNFVQATNDVLHTVDLTLSSDIDTILFPVTVDGEISPLTGYDGNSDTLTLEVAVGYWGNMNTKPEVTTTNADFTISNRFDSYTYEDQTVTTSGTSQLYDQFKFIEGEIDTIKIVVTDGLFSLNNITIRSTNATVVTDIGQSFFAEKGIHIPNPMVNDQLIIPLPAGIPSLEVSLMSLDGQNIISKEITAYSNSIDVAELKGVYILKEYHKGTYEKIVIP